VVHIIEVSFSIQRCAEQINGREAQRATLLNSTVLAPASASFYDVPLINIEQKFASEF
jgi:hypothetical protein